MSENMYTEKEIEELKYKAEIFDVLQKEASLGWWTIDFEQRTLKFASFIRRNLGLNSDEHAPVSFDEFLQYIEPPYRESIKSNIHLFGSRGFYEETFRIKTRYGYSWVRARLGGKAKINDGEMISLGYLEFLNDNEITFNKQEHVEKQLEELLARNMSMSTSLLSLLKKDNSEEEILTKILNDLLKHFDGDRVYIFTYDWENEVQHNTHEVVRDGVAPQKENLQNIRLDDVPWWTERLSLGSPIIVDDVEGLKEKDKLVYDLLRSQEITSLISVPLISETKVFGYLGIDIVNRRRKWTSVDRQWFLSTANIISIIIELSRSEAEAVEKKEYFQNLFNFMPLALITLRPEYDENRKVRDAIITNMNPAAETVVMHTKEESINRSLLHMENNFDVSTIKKISSLLDKDNAAGSMEVEFITDQQRTLRGLSYISGDEEITLLLSDVSKTEATNKALRKSEATLRNLYENLPVGIAVYDKFGSLIDTNEKERSLFGVKNEEVKGVNLFNNPNLPDDYKQNARIGLKAECDIIYDFEKAKKQYIKTELTGVKNLIMRCTPLYDSHGNIDNYIQIVIDNTESFNARNRLIEFELIFNSIAEFAQIGLCSWNPLNKKFRATDPWFKNINSKPKECHEVGNIMDEYINFHTADYMKFKNFFNGIIDDPTLKLSTDARVRHGKEWRWLRCNYTVKEYDPEQDSIEVIGVNIDITDQKRTEDELVKAKQKAEESDRLKSAFLANMSHEIRTPLNAIVGFSDLLIDSEELEDRSQYISIIQKNTDLLLQLISDILDISKIESEELETPKEPTDINEVIESTIASLSVRTSNDVDVVIENPMESCVIMTNRSRLIQVISNLVSNALKFTEKGKVTVGYTLEKDQVRFYVKDTGMGISPEKINDIFDRFVKLNSFIPGTGLGLPITKRIVEILGGEIHVESEVGVGTTFYFNLPYSIEKDLPCLQTLQEEGKELPIETIPEEEIEPQEAENQKTVKKLILVAEDTESNYMLISSILKKSYDLVWATDGVEAVRLFHETKPDIVLMDMKMPLMGGLDASREIRKTDKTTPIIALTAFAFDSDKEKALDAGCNEYMTKPINPILLRKVINECLSIED